MKKTCTKCKATKQSRAFYKNMSRCKMCDRAKVEAWRRANPEKNRERKQRWRKTSVEVYKAAKRRARLRKYGLTPETYAAMAQRQDGKCAVCAERVELVIDHNHATGAVRSLLCNYCNTTLGVIENNLPKLWSFLLYLDGHNGR